MTKARIGIVGAGWWAVVNHIPELKKNPDCEIVAVQRLGADDLADVQRMFDIPRGFEDVAAMLNEVPMDGVVICSPHINHFEHASAALEAGCHVLIEKPMTTDAGQARALVALAEKAGKEIAVAYGWNFKPFVAAARRMAARLGRIEHVDLQMASALEDLMAGLPMKETEGARFRPPPSTWSDPKRSGGYGWGQLTHALGMFFRIADIASEEVYAITGKSPSGVDYYDALTVRFAGGATGSMSGASTVPKHLNVQVDIRIFGSEGVLYLDIERERLELRRRDGQDEVFPMQPGDGAYTCEYPVACLVDICLGRAIENPADGIVGLRAVEVLDAMYRSAASGKTAKV